MSDPVEIIPTLDLEKEAKIAATFYKLLIKEGLDVTTARELTDTFLARRINPD